jgi:lipoprotein signal peptidase
MPCPHRRADRPPSVRSDACAPAACVRNFLAAIPLSTSGRPGAPPEQVVSDPDVGLCSEGRESLPGLSIEMAAFTDMTPWVAAAGVAWGLDRLTKTVAEGRLSPGDSRRVGPLEIRPTYHRPPDGRPLRRRRLLGGWALAILSVAALVATGWVFSGLVAQIGLGAALGGAAGNLQDLRRHGAIFDFLDLGLGVFNLADVAIVGGLATAVLAAILAGGVPS